MTPNYQQRLHATGLVAIFDQYKMRNFWNDILHQCKSRLASVRIQHH